jgi:hypothetical protein
MINPGAVFVDCGGKSNMYRPAAGPVGWTCFSVMPAKKYTHREMEFKNREPNIKLTGK